MADESVYDAVGWGREDMYDGPASFAEAAEYLARWLAGHRVAPAVSETTCAEALSALAKAGLIISPALHDEVAQDYAAQLGHAHQAADDLLRGLDG